MPSGKEKSNVRKKMAQVLESPSLIFIIIVRSDNYIPLSQRFKPPALRGLIGTFNFDYYLDIYAFATG